MATVTSFQGLAGSAAPPAGHGLTAEWAAGIPDQQPRDPRITPPAPTVGSGAVGDPVYPATLQAVCPAMPWPVGLDDLLARLGAGPDTPCSLFACVSEDDVAASLGEVVSDNGYNPMQRAGLVQAMRGVFGKLGLAPMSLGGVAPAGSPKASAAEPPAASQPKLLAPEAPQDLIDIREVVDQAAGRAQAPPIGFAELAKLRQHYERVAGAPPPAEHLPSSEQLAALRAWLNMGRVPYVDFGVWSATGTRLAKFRKTEGAVLVGGTFVTKLVEAPSSPDAWAQSWAIFAVAMVTLGAATLGTMNLYRAGIDKLHRLFPARWSVLVTTDVVVRSERWGSLRETFERYPPRGFVSEMPWDAVIAASAYGVDGGMLSTWWQDHFVLPNTIASSSSAATHRIASVEDGVAPGGGDRKRSRTPKAKKTKKEKRSEKVGERNKGEVCGNWNQRKGACAGNAPCPHKRKHVCDVCGGNHRSADTNCSKKGGWGRGK